MRFIGLFVAAFLLAMAVFLTPFAAFAQEVATNTIEVPIGDWVGHSTQIVASVITLGFFWLLRQLPAQAIAVLKTMRAEQLLEKAVAYGVNAAAGATKGKKLSFNVGNAVVAQGAQYVIDNAPGWLIGWLGGEAGIKQKIIARLDFDDATAVVVAPGGNVAIVGK